MHVRELGRTKHGRSDLVTYAVREYRRNHSGRGPIQRTVSVLDEYAYCAGCASADCSHVHAVLRRRAATEGAHA